MKLSGNPQHHGTEGTVPKLPAGTRRDFLRQPLRCGLLVLLGAVSWRVSDWRNPGAANCDANNYCRTCGEYAQCNLPRALAAKEQVGGAL